MTKFANEVVIHDTADVTITDKKTGKVILNAVAQHAGITGSVSEEDLKAGIHNKKVYKIRTDKEVELSMKSAFASLEYWAMQQGVEVKEGTAFVTESQVVEIKDNAGTLEAEIKGDFAAKLTEAKVTDLNGEQDKVTVTLGKIEIPVGFEAKAGDKVRVYYKEEVEGNKLSIDSSKFSHSYEVQYKTIAYNPKSQEIYSDIYFIFPNCVPKGDFDISLENGSVYTPELGWSVLNNGDSDELGEIIQKVRK